MYEDLKKLMKIRCENDTDVNICLFNKSYVSEINVYKDILFRLGNSNKTNTTIYNISNFKLLYDNLKIIFDILHGFKFDFESLDNKINNFNLMDNKSKNEFIENNIEIYILLKFQQLFEKVNNNSIDESGISDFIKNPDEYEIFNNHIDSHFIYSNLFNTLRNKFYEDEFYNFDCILEENSDIKYQYERYCDEFDKVCKFIFNTSKDKSKIKNFIFSFRNLFLSHLLITSSTFKKICRNLYKMVIVESVDKLGKSSFCEDIQFAIKDECVYYHFPSTNIYNIAPKVKSTEYRQLSFSIDTMLKMKEFIKKAIDTNNLYLIDRSLLSGLIYSQLDFKKSSEYYYFIELLENLYNEYFYYELKIMQYIDIKQFIIINKDSKKMKIEFDKDDIIEKDFNKEKWEYINEKYINYCESNLLKNRFLFFKRLKDYIIEYDNSKNKTLKEKRKDRVKIFLNSYKEKKNN